jgi:hypothetical protein
LHLLASNQKNNPKNVDYCNVVKVTNIEELKKAVQFDHVSIMLKDGHRNNENFVMSDCIMIDVDNQNVSSDNQYTIAAFLHDFRRYKAFVVESKSNNKEKHGIIRERFHVYFPIKRTEDINKYIQMKRKLSEKCHNDGDSLDVSRFFFGIDGPVVYKTNGRQFIDDAKWLQEKNNFLLEGKTFAITSEMPGDGKTQYCIKPLGYLLSKALFSSTTWLSARNFDVKTWESTLNTKYIRTGKYLTIKYIFIDEATLLWKCDFDTIRKAYPRACIFLVGDLNQTKFKGNAFETVQFDGCLTLHNEKDPRIVDIRLRNFIIKLQNGEIDWKFITDRMAPQHTKNPIVGLTNKNSDLYNQKFELTDIDVLVRACNTTKKWSNGEFFRVRAIDNEYCLVKLQRIDGSTIDINFYDYLGESLSFGGILIKNFAIAESMTTMRCQGLTLDKVTVDVDSYFIGKGNQYICHKSTLIEGLLTGASRVRNADDVTFISNLELSEDDIVIEDWKKRIIKAPKNEVIDSHFIAGLGNESEFEKFINEKFCNTKFSNIYKTEVLQNQSKKGDVFWGTIPCEICKPEETEAVDEILDTVIVNYSKGSRNKASCQLIGILKKKAERQLNRGFLFNLRLAWEYAQSIIGCEESETIWKMYN